MDPVDPVDLVDQLQRSVPHPIFHKHRDGPFLGCNAAYAEMMGVDRVDIIGADAAAFMSADLLLFEQTLDAEVLKSGQPRSHEYGMRDRSGVFRKFVFHKAPFHDSAGSITGIVGVILDVTEKALATRKLKRSQDLQDAVLNSIDDVIVVVNAEDRTISLVNPAVTAVFGYEPDELIGKSTDILHVDQAHFQQFATGWDPELDRKGAFRIEYPMKRRDGTIFPTEITVSELSKERGWRAGVVSFIRDVSDRKRAEAQLAAKDEQLRQAQRMESIGRLAGGIAHDFNNILTAIGGYVHMATDAVGEDQSAMRAIDGIRAGASRAARLTKQLLLFSRKTPSEIRRIDLNATITNLNKMLDRLIGENVTIEISCTPEELWIDGDDGKIEQVVMNLILNAVDAMPQGGTVRVRTERVQSGTTRSTALMVEDTGIGMDKETQARIFEPFYTTKPKGSGTGLGLAVVYGIVQEHGGAIGVESRPGEGTCISVTFPESRLEAAAAGPEHLELLPNVGRGGRILIVEDEPEIVSVVSTALREFGYDVVEALDIASAYRKWKTSGKPFDLVVSDVMLPDGSGTSLLDLLQPVGDTRFVFVSGYLEDKIEFEMLRSGGHPFVHKPYSIVTLQQVVAEELARPSDTATE